MLGLSWHRSVTATVIAVLAFAGCVTPTTDLEPAAADASLLPDLTDVAAAALDAERGRLWWETFVRATPERHAGSPTNTLASEMLRDELAANGYDARIMYYVPPGTESPLDQGIKVVVGVKEGAVTPDRVVGWVAHYDTQRGTIYGAYDDGSGVAVAMELARALAEYPNEKTLMPIFFDAEEIGLVASDYFVQQVMAEAKYTFDLVIGHDMTGINCPGHDWQMYQFVGENHVTTVRPILEELFAAHLTPEENACITFHDEAFRNSDERRFKEVGVPVIRMAGGFKATDYPMYHLPGDTVEYVYDFAGGPEAYESGFGLTVKTSYWAAVAFDRLPGLDPVV